jgi:hypothetical protein
VKCPDGEKAHIAIMIDEKTVKAVEEENANQAS